MKKSPTTHSPQPETGPQDTGPVPLSSTDPVLRHLSDRAGGPAGTHLRAPDAAGRRGSSFWSIPVILTALTAVAIVLSALTTQYCRANGWGGVEVYHYGCYSDVAALWGSRDLSTSAWAPFMDSLATFEYPVLTALLASVVAAVTHGVMELGGGYWGERGGLLFWDLTFLLAAGAWIVLVLLTMRSAGRRPWDAAIVALSPAMIFGIGINWDIWAAVALAAAILCVQRRRWWAAGVFIGVGISFKLYPLFLLGALLTLAIRTWWRRETPADGINFAALGRVAATSAASWLLINVTVMLINFEAWSTFFTFSSERGAGYSSLWHVWMMVGASGPSAEVVSTGSLLLFALACVGVLVVGLVAGPRPRMVQLLFLIVAAFLLFNKVYSPQFMMWLVPLMVLAAPRLRDVIIWHVAQLLHYWAVWMHLADVVGDYEVQHSFDPNLYVLAVLVHMASTVYIMVQVIWDIFRPERDVVRKTITTTANHSPTR